MPVATQRKLQTPKKPSILSTRIWKQLDDYQQDAVEFCLDVQTAGLFFEQGTGKTWIAGGVIEALVSPTFAGLLVVPLANLESSWVKFLTKQLPQVTLCRTWDSFKAAPFPKLLLQHYEALKAKRYIDKLARFKWSFVGYDEAQRLKNRSSLESRNAAKLRKFAPYRLILSGTPIEENPSDLWAQFRFLAPEVLGTVWKDFEARFLEPIDDELITRFKEARPQSFKWKLMLKQIRIASGRRAFDFEKLDEFLGLVSPYCLRVTKDVLKLPPMSVQPVGIRMFGRQRALYEQLARDMVAPIDSESRITTPLRITQVGRLHQICGGFATDDEGYVHEVGRAKLRKLRSIVRREQHKGPIVIFCRYLAEVFALEDELIGDHPTLKTLTGRNRKERGPLIESFQEGEISVLICQIKTGGVGIDLFRSCVAIFYSTTYSFIDFEQALARVHRRGQTKPVTIYVLVVWDTIDHEIYSAILAKRRITSRVLINFERRRPRNGQDQRSPREGGTGEYRRIQVRRGRRGGSAQRQRRNRPHEAA